MYGDGEGICLFFPPDATGVVLKIWGSETFKELRCNPTYKAPKSKVVVVTPFDVTAFEK